MQPDSFSVSAIAKDRQGDWGLWIFRGAGEAVVGT